MKELKNMFNEILTNINTNKKKEVELKINQNKIQQNYIENSLTNIFEAQEGSIWQIPNYKDNSKIIFSTNFGKSKWGLIDLETQEVSKTIYNICYVINNIIIIEDTDIYIDAEDNKYECYSYGILDLKDQEIIILNNENNIKKGLIISDEEIDFKYSNYKYYPKENFIAIKDKKTNKYSFINTKSKEIISCIYDYCGNFSDGFIKVRKNNKWGFVNKKGEEIIPCKYNYCYGFSEGLATVGNNRKYGFINTKGEEVIPLIYNYCTDFSEGLAIIEKNNKWGFINKQGEEITSCIYDYCSNFHEGLARVSKDNKWGFINTNGEEIIPLIYDRCFDFLEELAVVNKNKKFCFINKQGEEVIPYKYKNCYNFSGGLAFVIDDNKFGFIDKNLKEYWFDENNCFEKVGSRSDNLYYKKYKDTFVIKIGCFLDTLENFEKAVKETHGNNEFSQQYFEIIDFLKENLNSNWDKIANTFNKAIKRKGLDINQVKNISKNILNEVRNKGE